MSEKGEYNLDIIPNFLTKVWIENRLAVIGFPPSPPSGIGFLSTTTPSWPRISTITW